MDPVGPLKLTVHTDGKVGQNFKLNDNFRIGW